MKKSKRDELIRLAEYHASYATETAERSHEFEGEVGDAYSAVSEAHNQLAKAFRKKAGVANVDDAE
jgi:hypothetical protein